MFEHLIAQYGYPAVLLGTTLEGETVLILAGIGAHQGYLSLPGVLLMATIGGTLGDQTAFFLGRYCGSGILKRFPRIAERTGKVNDLLARFDIGVIICMRFLYGLRVAGPIVVGMGPIPAWRFMLLNTLGAAIWASLIGGAGYLFGNAVTWFLAGIKRYENTALLFILVAAVIAGLAYTYQRWRKQHRPPM